MASFRGVGGDVTLGDCDGTVAEERCRGEEVVVDAVNAGGESVPEGVGGVLGRKQSGDERSDSGRGEVAVDLAGERVPGPIGVKPGEEFAYCDVVEGNDASLVALAVDDEGVSDEIAGDVVGVGGP